MTKQNIIELLTNEGVCVIDKKSYLLITDIANNKATVKINNNDIIVSDKFGNRDTVNKDDSKGLIFTVFSALETEYNYTTNYLNQFLLDCETGQDEIFINTRGFNESIEVIDVLGLVEEKGRIYIALEVEYEDYCYLLHVNFLNTWDFVYKDEMLEIQDTLSRVISEQLKIDLDISNILDDVKNWLNESVEDGHNEIDLLKEVVNNGVEYVAPNHLIYTGDIMDFYDSHYIEIDEVLKRDNMKHENNNISVWYVWEKVAFEYLTELENK